MATINTNVASLTAQRDLANSQMDLNTSLQRLSSGLKINSGADDPSGLIASESLRSEMSGITQAVSNSQQATNVIATAEGALNEVSSLLLNIKGMIVQAANTGAMTTDEIAANQLQVDSAVDSITRIANTTTFAGLPLINGNLDYVTSGVHTSAITSLQISEANFGTASTMPVTVDVLASAKTAQLEFTGSAIANSVTLQISGTEGVQTLSFTSGTKASAISFAVNQLSDSTGVTAGALNGHAASGVIFSSTGYGSKNFVAISAQNGTFTTKDLSGNVKGRAVGTDVDATVNGAKATGDGLSLKVNTQALNLSLTLAPKTSLGTQTFAITGGGALFQLGAIVSSAQQVNIGIQSVAASNLGDSATGFLSDIQTGGKASLVGGKEQNAEAIVEEAISQVADLRGRLGAFEKNTLTTNVSSLGIALDNVTASESNIRDTDFAAETSNLTRDQILVQAGTSVLATANSTPQNILALLKA